MLQLAALIGNQFVLSISQITMLLSETSYRYYSWQFGEPPSETEGSNSNY
jgi:hypothetical protein